LTKTVAHPGGAEVIEEKTQIKRGENAEKTRRTLFLLLDVVFAFL
jgi:hypothetical protein